jgi:hypothetical protein
LEFVGYADSLKPSDMLTINVHEFAFSATMRNELLSLNYIDMVAIYERIHQQEFIEYQKEQVAI